MAMRPILWIVVHTCGAYDGKAKRVVHQSVQTVRAYHMLAAIHGGKGWHDIGYHRYVEVDGAARLGRADATVGAHASGFNDFSLGICCSGHGDHEPFNPEQTSSLVAQLVAWSRLYFVSPDHIIGHRETAQHGGPPVEKTCPGLLVDMGDIRHRVRDELGGMALHEEPITLIDVPRFRPN
jgi:N-acetyl-anhydromuramyl-L-alanine amidase AmpD